MSLQRDFTVDILDHILHNLNRYVAVDRGHKHTDGSSESNIWLSEIPHVAPRGWHEPPDGPGDHPPDDQDRRRGRSPPTDHSNPWAGGYDPWSAASADARTPFQRSPPRKARRQRGRSSNLWDNWLPTTASIVMATSVTPDPPWVRPPRLGRARLRPTGTPPLEVATDQDGTPFVATGSVNASTLAATSGLPLSLSILPSRRPWADTGSDDSDDPQIVSKTLKKCKFGTGRRFTNCAGSWQAQQAAARGCGCSLERLGENCYDLCEFTLFGRNGKVRRSLRSPETLLRCGSNKYSSVSR